MSTEAFDCAAEKLEDLTDFDRIEARGTVRIVLKEAGLSDKNLTLAELEAVFSKLMPEQLEKRGVDDAEAVCSAVVDEIRLAGISSKASGTASRDAVFGRLGGR